MVYLWIISVNLVFVKYVNTEKSIKLLQLFNNAAAVLVVLLAAVSVFLFFQSNIVHFSVQKSVFK